MKSRLALRVLAALLAFAVLARIPVGFDVGFRFDSALAVIWAFGLLSLVLLTGYVGQISLCQATFAGVGAYTAGMLVASLHIAYMLAVDKAEELVAQYFYRYGDYLFTKSEIEQQGLLLLKNEIIN